MYGVVNRVEVQFFRTLSDFELIFTSTGFSHHSFLEVGLGVPNDFSEQFSETRSVVCLFECIAAESLCDLRISFAVSLTSHSEVLTYFGTFAHEVRTQTFSDNRVFLVFSHAEDVFANEIEFVVGGYFPFNDLFALRATLGSFGTFVYIAANRANKFLYHSVKFLRG